jgi:hypothetical protein
MNGFSKSIEKIKNIPIYEINAIDYQQLQNIMLQTPLSMLLIDQSKYLAQKVIKRLRGLQDISLIQEQLQYMKEQMKFWN